MSSPGLGNDSLDAADWWEPRTGAPAPIGWSGDLSCFFRLCRVVVTDLNHVTLILVLYRRLIGSPDGRGQSVHAVITEIST